MVASSLVKYPHYQVDVARDGAQALESIKKAPPAMVVTDIMMPNMDGWSLASALYDHPKYASIPLLFLSALGPDADRLAELGLSERHHISKPFRFQELEERISQLVEKQPAQAPEPAPPPTSALDGYLEQLGLSSLLVMMEMERKDGVLTLYQESPTSKGQVFLRAGRVVSACLENQPKVNPKDATYKMLRWNKGRFSFEATGVDLDDEVQVSTTGLLMESARIADEETRNA